MSKNYMAEVAKLLGVELGESFEITSNTQGDYHNYYRFTENNCLEISDDGVEWKTTIAAVLLKHILIGDIRIVKLPWKPQEGDRYYFPCPASIEKWDYSTWSERDVDYYRLNYGFVCKTMEEAIALTEKMLEAINEQ